MKISYERFAVLAASRQQVEVALRELDIPPHPLVHRARPSILVVAMNDPSRSEVLRGQGPLPWATCPGHAPERQMIANMSVNLGTREMVFHELVARHLAWRLWHDC